MKLRVRFKRWWFTPDLIIRSASEPHIEESLRNPGALIVYDGKNRAELFDVLFYTLTEDGDA